LRNHILNESIARTHASIIAATAAAATLPPANAQSPRQHGANGKLS
jgi:hypothetical protein